MSKKVSLIIKNGEICTSHGRFKADIAIDDEKIVAIGNKLYFPEGEKVIDASGKVIIPGIIYTHCHYRDPGYTYKEDFTTGTRASAAGGVTTSFSMTNVKPLPTTLENFEAWKESASKKCIIDYALYGGYGRTTSKLENISKLAKAGAIGIKVFQFQDFRADYPHVPELAITDWGIIHEIFENTAKIGIPVTVHPGFSDWSNKLVVREFIDKGKNTVSDYHEVANKGYLFGHEMVMGTQALIYIAKLTGARLLVVHVGIMKEEAYDLFRQAKKQGIDVHAEMECIAQFMTPERVKKQENEGVGEYKEISRGEALKIEAVGGEKTERLRMDVGRDYLYGRALAHVLGYLGEVSEEEVESGQWGLGDLVGRTGVEEKYEETLRGQDGGVIYEVDTQGNRVRKLGGVKPLPGRDLRLSIDAQLSQVAYQSLESRPGAVIATEVKTGKILVLVSSPAFDPNHITPEDLIDKKKPMFNRSIGGVYPPGSTFKVVTAVAGVEEGKVDENTTYEDMGFIQIGEYIYKNWYYSQYNQTEGVVDLVQAIKRSTDTFFYKVGEWVGANKLAEWGRAFGLGQKSGIDLPGEVEGLVPTPKWKEKTTEEKWFLGNTYHLAIGQADLLTTPLQINMMTSVIANGGKLCKPTVIQDISDSGPKGFLRGETKCQSLNLKPETLRLVKEGMKEACSAGGTAFPFFDFRVLKKKQGSDEQSESGSYFSPQVGGKTGTAEFGDPGGRTHAWFTAFAPIDDSEIVVTALVEAGGEGSYVAAPIVKKVMEAWFSSQ